MTTIVERSVWTPQCEKIQNQTERGQCERIIAGYNKSLQSATTVAPATTQSKSTTTAKPQSRMLYQKTGGGNHAAQPFQAPDEWRLLWSYDCSNFKQCGGGNFIVSDDAGAGVAVNELGTGGKGEQQGILTDEELRDKVKEIDREASSPRSRVGQRRPGDAAVDHHRRPGGFRAGRQGVRPVLRRGRPMKRVTLAVLLLLAARCSSYSAPPAKGTICKGVMRQFIAS
jgi:hypothetical protein